MDLQLNDKVALLVGGRGTIGQAVARALVAEGAKVVVADLMDADGQSDDTGVVPIDVTDEASVKRCVERVRTGQGGIDILVVLAGVYQGNPIVETSAADWDRLLEINLKGTFLVCRELLPHFQTADFGRIICLASLAGQVGGLVAGANYAASKAGVLSLVKSLAKQVQNPQVTVNAVNPGPVVGTMTDSWAPEIREMVLTRIPVGRFASPDEIADVITFLASPRASYIHGAHIDVNGGTYLD